MLPVKIYNTQDEFFKDMGEELSSAIDVGRCCKTCIENHNYVYPIMVQKLGKSSYDGMYCRFLVWDQNDILVVKSFLGL